MALRGRGDPSAYGILCAAYDEAIRVGDREEAFALKLLVTEEALARREPAPAALRALGRARPTRA